MPQTKPFARPFYMNVLRRNSHFIGFVLLGAFVFEAFTGSAANLVWNISNNGVRSPL